MALVFLAITGLAATQYKITQLMRMEAVVLRRKQRGKRRLGYARGSYDPNADVDIAVDGSVMGETPFAVDDTVRTWYAD